MRKNDLIEQNNVLFDKLQKSLVINKDLQEEINKKNEQVLQMQNQLNELSKRVEELSKNNGFVVRTDLESCDIEEPIETNADNVVENEPIKFSEEIEYGAKIIGKIVVESAKASEQVADNVELKNLILFKTESIKAEILSICNSDVSFEDKKGMIDFQLQEAIDYYRSIVAQ